MITQTGLAGDVALFLLETIIQAALFGVLVSAAIWVFGIRHPGLRADLWLMALICPVVAPLIFHILLPRSGARHEWKLLEPFLVAPLSWLEAHELLALLILATILAVLFGLDVLRWLVGVLRARESQRATPAADAQAARCAVLLPIVGRRLQVRKLPALCASGPMQTGVYALRWPRPRICLAGPLAQRLENDELQGLLAHELSHLQRRDWLRLLIAQLSRDLMFFNPFAHLAYTLFLQATEEAADDLAATTPGERLALASCLVKVQRHVQAARLAPPGLGLMHRPAGAAYRAERLLDASLALACPVAHVRVARAVLILAFLLAGLI